ncbi:hypothetical protein BH20CHL7_BH20CHL7_03630 [soil metagenome]
MRTTAELFSRRILDHLRRPIDLDGRSVRVGASIGVVVIAPAERLPTLGRLHATSDRLMYKAKKNGGGLRMAPRREAADPG